MTDINKAKQNTIDSARKKASSKAKKYAPERPSTTQGLTSYEDLISNYSTSFTTTISGNTFEIQKIDPGTYMSITGSPLIQVLSESDIDLSNREEVEQAIDELPDEEKLQYVQTDEFLLFMRKVVCAGIVSLNFVCKRQNQCNRMKKELSIDLLSGNDLMELYNTIMAMSIPESEGDTVTIFRSNGEKPEEQPDSDLPDSEEVREAAV